MIEPKVQKPTKAQEKAAYEAVTVRDQNRCVRCGAYGIERDHRQNRQSGNTVPSNLQGLCPPCHRWKTEHPHLALLEGFACPRWAQWAFWPAWRHDVQGWVIYFDRPDSRGRWWTEISQAVADLLMRGGAE